MNIVTFNIAGLPRLSKNKSKLLRKLQLIDSDISNDNDAKYGICYLTPLQGFVAKETVKGLILLFDHYNNENFCNELLSKLYSKLSVQSDLKNILFTVEIEYYLDDISDDYDKYLLKLVFFNKYLDIKLYYKKLVYSYTQQNQLKNIVLTRKVVETKGKYSLFNYFPSNLIYLDINEFCNPSCIKELEYEIIVNAMENKDKLIETMNYYDEIDKTNEGINFKNYNILNLNLKTFKKNYKSKTKYYITAKIKKISNTDEEVYAPMFYDNVLHKFDKEFTLVFFIAACLLYYDNSKHVVLAHSFRKNGSFKDYFNTLELYDYLLDILNPNTPSISIIAS